MINLASGEIVAWEIGARNVPFSSLINALGSAGLDPNVARAFTARQAFIRACKKMSKQQLITKTSSRRNIIAFQFNKRVFEDNKWAFPYTTEVQLDLETGAISCPIVEIGAAACAALDMCMTHRTPSDVTRIIQAIFDKNGDLMPIKKNGGTYFVPVKQTDLLDKVSAFVTAIGGYMIRYQIVATEATKTSLADTVSSYLGGLLADYRKQIEKFNETTKATTLAKAAANIKAARFKIEAWHSLMLSRASEVDAGLVETDKLLHERLLALKKETEAVIVAAPMAEPTPEPLPVETMVAAELPKETVACE